MWRQAGDRNPCGWLLQGRQVGRRNPCVWLLQGHRVSPSPPDSCSLKCTSTLWQITLNHWWHHTGSHQVAYERVYKLDGTHLRSTHNRLHIYRLAGYYTCLSIYIRQKGPFVIKYLTRDRRWSDDIIETLDFTIFEAEAMVLSSLPHSHTLNNRCWNKIWMINRCSYQFFRVGFSSASDVFSFLHLDLCFLDLQRCRPLIQLHTQDSGLWFTTVRLD